MNSTPNALMTDLPAVYKNLLQVLMVKSSKIYSQVHDWLERPWAYNLMQVFLGPGKKRHVVNFLKGVPFESVVDIGCGPGVYVDLARGKYLGIDMSPSFIAACRKRYGNDPNKVFKLADATTLELTDRYDLALLNSVLHHLSDMEAVRLVEWAARSARYMFVLDLYPMPWNPISRWMYALDRGQYVRTPEQQKGLILRHPAMRLVKEGDALCVNGVYRHSLFVFESVATPSG